MDLDQLHTFLEIVRLKSFSKAAQSCYRTQPAVSAQVRQLEQELNAPLFDRLGTRIALTPAGQIFAEHAEQILELRKRAQDSIHELERVPRGELVIAANEATCIYVLPRVFAEFKKRFPNVQLLVDRAYGSRVVEAVLENKADFGIADEIKVLMPPGHPLAAHETILPADLAGHQLLLPKAGTTRSRLNLWFEPVEEQLQISMELDSTEMIKQFAIADLGLGFVAGAHCREEVALGKLVARSIGPEPMIRQIGLVYRKDKALSKAALGFIEVTLSHAVTDSVSPGKRSAAERHAKTVLAESKD